MRTINTQSTKTSLIEAIKEHGTWFTISAIGFILIFGSVLINDPSKWWIGLAVAAGLSALLFAAVNGRVVLKAIGSVFVLCLTVAGATTAGSLVATVPLYGLSWPIYQIAVYLCALAFSYVTYSGRGRWTYLGLMSVSQFLLTLFMVVLNTDPHLSIIVSSGVALGGFIAAYLFNGKTRVSSEMPNSGFSEELTKAVFKAAENRNLSARVIPSKGSLDSHFLIFGNSALVIYPLDMEQAFGVTGRRGTQLSYKGKSINPWLLRLSFFTSPSWKAKGASPALVLADIRRKNGADGKVIGVSLPDSKRKAVVGIMPAPAIGISKANYGERLIDNAFSLMESYTFDLSPKQKLALGKVGLGKEDIIELQDESENESVTVNLNKTTHTDDELITATKTD